MKVQLPATQGDRVAIEMAGEGPGRRGAAASAVLIDPVGEGFGGYHKSGIEIAQGAQGQEAGGIGVEIGPAHDQVVENFDLNELPGAD